VKSGGSRKGGDEDRGAGAEGVGRVSLFLLGMGSGDGLCPLPLHRKILKLFISK